MHCLHFKPISEKHISIYLHPFILSKDDRIYRGIPDVKHVLTYFAEKIVQYVLLHQGLQLSLRESAGKGRGMVTSVPQEHKRE